MSKSVHYNLPSQYGSGWFQIVASVSSWIEFRTVLCIIVHIQLYLFIMNTQCMADLIGDKAYKSFAKSRYK